MATEIHEELDLTPELDEFQLIYEDASKGMRFLNLIIDTIMYYITSTVMGIGIGVIALLVGNDSLLDEYETPTETVFYFFMGLVVYWAYFAFTEIAFNGKTIGKMLTKTRTVDVNGGPASRSQIFKRSLYRIIPFDAFSVLLADDGRGWHDSFSATRVVKEK